MNHSARAGPIPLLAALPIDSDVIPLWLAELEQEVARHLGYCAYETAVFVDLRRGIKTACQYRMAPPRIDRPDLRPIFPVRPSGVAEMSEEQIKSDAAAFRAAVAILLSAPRLPLLVAHCE